MSFGLQLTHLFLPDCFRDDVGRAQLNSNVMIALRTSPPAPSTIESNALGKRRTLANVITRFTAKVSNVGAIGLNLRAICRSPPINENNAKWPETKRT